VNGYEIEPGANVRHASLTNFNDGTGLPPARANLEGANLTGAELWIQDLREANLRHANMERTNLTGTRMPDGSIHD